MRCYFLRNLSPVAPQLAVFREKFAHNLLRIQILLKHYSKYYTINIEMY